MSSPVISKSGRTKQPSRKLSSAKRLCAVDVVHMNVAIRVDVFRPLAPGRKAGFRMASPAIHNVCGARVVSLKQASRLVFRSSTFFYLFGSNQVTGRPRQRRFTPRTLVYTYLVRIIPMSLQLPNQLIHTSTDARQQLYSDDEDTKYLVPFFFCFSTLFSHAADDAKFYFSLCGYRVAGCAGASLRAWPRASTSWAWQTVSTASTVLRRGVWSVREIWRSRSCCTDRIFGLSLRAEPSG